MSNKEVRGPTFSVSVPDIHRVEYREGDRSAIVEIEGEGGRHGQVRWSIYRETLRGWESPHVDSQMTAEKRDEIIERISNSLDLLKMPHQVV